jgi:midasin (ATPase involved in ribosome maturation)
MIIAPNKEELSDDKEDALTSEEDALNQSTIISDERAAEHDADLLDQADKASRSSFELDI